MNVAAVQFKGNREDSAGTLARLSALAEVAAEGADLVVLPEMALTQYLFESAEHARLYAERADGPTFAALSPIAKAHGCWLTVGLPEVDGDALFNSALVIDPAGELRFTYRKTLLFEADETWARPGDSGYVRFDTDAGSFAVGICMDLNDDRFVLWCRDAGVDVVALPTNWLHEEESDVWRYWAWRMAPLQGAALVAANTWGAEAETVFCGRSAVLQRRTVLAAAPPVGNAVIRAGLLASPPGGP